MTQFLIIYLADDLNLVSASSPPSKSLQFANKEYTLLNKRQSGFLGCYDWLRHPDGHVVGFRLWVDTPSLQLVTIMPNHKYIYVEGPGVFRVMFEPTNAIDEPASMDQDFGNAYVYTSNDGDVAIVVDADALSSGELMAVTHGSN